MKRLLATIGLLFFVSPAFGATKLVHFDQSRNADGFALNLGFSKTVSSNHIGVQYVDDGIEVFVSEAKASRAEKTVLIDDPQVASVGYFSNPKGLRVKIGVVPGVQSASLKDNFQFAAHGKNVTLLVGAATLAQAPVSTATKVPAATEAVDADLEAQLQALNNKADVAVAPVKAPAATTAPAVVATKTETSNSTAAAPSSGVTAVAVTTDEESIPVFGKKEVVASPIAAVTSPSNNSTSIKLTLTLCVLGLLGAGGYFAAKKWPTKKTKGKKHMIQILSQSYLGPKRSLAVVQVAGETVLIGVTDSNISLIKTLALIDDEVSPDNKKKFVEALNNSEQEFDANDIAVRLSKNVEDDFTMQGLQSVVDGKLKNMRSF